jgi:hypothetical protein
MADSKSEVTPAPVNGDSTEGARHYGHLLTCGQAMETGLWKLFEAYVTRAEWDGTCMQERRHGAFLNTSARITCEQVDRNGGLFPIKLTITFEEDRNGESLTSAVEIFLDSRAATPRCFVQKKWAAGPHFDRFKSDLLVHYPDAVITEQDPKPRR